MGGAHFPGDNVAEEVAGDGDVGLRDVGKMEHGCEHYRRRCKIVAPCCNEVFPCRHCHNEATVSGDRHTICRQDVEKVVCLLCDTEQPVSQVCINCGVTMGEYFCDICKFYDDDTEKGQYHCYGCGICRVGGRDNYFHCVKCDGRAAATNIASSRAETRVAKQRALEQRSTMGDEQQDQRRGRSREERRGREEYL